MFVHTDTWWKVKIELELKCFKFNRLSAPRWNVYSLLVLFFFSHIFQDAQRNHYYHWKTEQHEYLTLITLWLQDFHMSWCCLMKMTVLTWTVESANRGNERNSQSTQTCLWILWFIILLCSNDPIYWAVKKNKFKSVGKVEWSSPAKAVVHFSSFWNVVQKLKLPLTFLWVVQFEAFRSACKGLAWNNRRDHFYLSTNIGLYFCGSEICFSNLLSDFPFPLPQNSNIPRP